MSVGVLHVARLGKAYRGYRSELGRFLSWFGLPVKPAEEHWVLRDINFTVQPGEAVGIVGQNGAGKSTLLKLITGTTRPTEGHVHINGRVAAILELGMGFNPELTGRQNAMHAAGLMGLGYDEILKIMPEIEAFAEIGEYFDQPVRVYSSGMQMRLAFSVATAHRPDVLIVDEALSVGDAYFQHKSFDRVREFRKQGTTLLIVSHDKNAIQAVCDRAILLNGGRLAMQGEPEAVMDYYNAMLADHQNQTVKQVATESGKTQTISGTGEATVKSIALVDENGNPLEVVDVGQLVRLQIQVQVNASIERLVLGYGIKDHLGQVIYGTNTYHKRQPLQNVIPGEMYLFDIAFPANLGPGTYSVVTAIHSTDTHLERNYEWRDFALIFNVINISKPHFGGVAWIDPVISVCRT